MINNGSSKSLNNRLGKCEKTIEFISENMKTMNKFMFDQEN
jgi:hypothetical protein